MKNERHRRIALTLVSLMLARMSFAADSKEEAVRKMFEKRAEIERLQAKVVEAPDDKARYRALLEAGLSDYEGYYARAKFPADIHENILLLKFVMEDMHSIQAAIAEMGSPTEDGKILLKKLRTKKVPWAHRRAVPLIDPWGTPYRLFVLKESGQFKIVSAGSDKKFESDNLSITTEELRDHTPKKSTSLATDIVFVDGSNFTRIYDYPERAQTFLYTRCTPADELKPERTRCW